MENVSIAMVPQQHDIMHKSLIFLLQDQPETDIDIIYGNDAKHTLTPMILPGYIK